MSSGSQRRWRYRWRSTCRTFSLH
uniref:Uncharacterized protein n=1 Tax=Anguilla anguilla TaxID=7936 RepID=A0A0E9SQG0_ANGAN